MIAATFILALPFHLLYDARAAFRYAGASDCCAMASMIQRKASPDRTTEWVFRRCWEEYADLQATLKRV